MDWDKYSWVMRSKQRQKILRSIESPNTPSEVAKDVDAHISQASRSLSQFCDKGIAKVLNEEAKKGRLYTLTDDGKEILEHLRKDD